MLDDSPDHEAGTVVRALSDPRIIYRSNTVNLGQIRNINQAFSPVPYIAGARIGAVLEDDNQWEPEWLVRKRLTGHHYPDWIKTS